MPKENEAYERTLEVIQAASASQYFSHIEREGFAWIRFSKPSGTEVDQRCLFEVRYKGSKIDHPDSILDLEDSIAKTLPLLGNTPVKLQLEVEPSQRKQKTPKKSTSKKRAKHLEWS